VAAVDRRSRDLGEIEGYSPRILVMKYVGSGGDVQPGDKIVTSSVSEIFPPGVPVGTVTRAEKKEHDLFYRIEVEPAAKFSKLEELFFVF
jgi:rod shape-determining protein MreC